MHRVLTSDDVDPAWSKRARETLTAMRGEYVRLATEAGLRHRVSWTALTPLDESSQPLRVIDTLDPFERTSAAFLDLRDRLTAPELRQSA